MKNRTSYKAAVRYTKRQMVVEIPPRGYESFGVVFSAQIDLKNDEQVNVNVVDNLKSVSNYIKVMLFQAIAHDRKIGMTYDQLSMKYRVSKNTIRICIKGFAL